MSFIHQVQIISHRLHRVMVLVVIYLLHHLIIILIHQNGYAPIDQDLNAYQMMSENNGNFDDGLDPTMMIMSTAGGQSPPMSLMGK